MWNSFVTNSLRYLSISFMLPCSQSKNVQLNALSDSCRIYGSSQSANEAVMMEVDKYLLVNYIEHLWFAFI